MIYDGPPSCDDVNNNYALLSEAADASSSGYYRCEGCGDYGDIVNWDTITELELNGQNGWGHYTIYSMFSFFLLLPSIHTNLPLAMAMATTSKSLRFSFLVFFSFIYIYFLPFFVAFSSDPFFFFFCRGRRIQNHSGRWQRPPRELCCNSGCDLWLHQCPYQRSWSAAVPMYIGFDWFACPVDGVM